VSGHYNGDVLADAWGTARAGVSVTVSKTALNTVTISTDYARIPERTSVWSES
jgi:hypothetical protein